MKISVFHIFLCFLLPAILYGQADEHVTIKVLTLNILHGATTNNDFDLDKIAKVIIENDPDFVMLQEVDFMTNRARKMDLTIELAYRSKMQGIFGRAMSYDGGEYGEALLSKHSIVSSVNYPLPCQEGNEPRAALSIVTKLPSGDSIQVIGTHLDHLRKNTDRMMQVNEILKIFESPKYPTVFGGDLNDVPGSEVINALESLWTSTYEKMNPEPTFPSGTPERKIDYIMYYPNSGWEVISKRVINDPIASDHCGYLVTLKLQK